MCCNILPHAYRVKKLDRLSEKEMLKCIFFILSYITQKIMIPPTKASFFLNEKPILHNEIDDIEIFI